MRLDLEQMVERLATVRRPWLIATARRAGAGADAEDAVQDVLARLTAGAALPRDERSALAYAATAVRRRALDLAAARNTPAPPPAEAGEASGPAEDHERRRALRAFAQALEALPERPRAVLVLDAAGWSRADIARRLDVSERVVKRTLADHRSAVVASASAAVGGEDCARLSATLATYAAGIGRPRFAGPVARHLEVCDACRLTLVRARALRALFPPPTAFGIGAAPTPAVPLVALKIGAAIVAAVTAAGGVGIVVQRPAPGRAIAPVAPLVAPIARLTPPPAITPVQRVVPRVQTVPATSRPRRRAEPTAKRRTRPPATPTPTAGRAPTATPAATACDLGTLGICGLGE
jgi:RNA polymerase sigma factor (sigma-70 family)